MNAIRQYIEVKDHALHVNLPKDFNAKNVEVIIIPNDENLIELTTEQKIKLDQALLQDKKTFISKDEIKRKYNL